MDKKILGIENCKFPQFLVVGKRGSKDTKENIIKKGDLNNLMASGPDKPRDPLHFLANTIHPLNKREHLVMLGNLGINIGKPILLELIDARLLKRLDTATPNTFKWEFWVTVAIKAYKNQVDIVITQYDETTGTGLAVFGREL